MALNTFLFVFVALWAAVFVAVVTFATLSYAQISKRDVREKASNTARKFVVAVLLAATANEMTHHAEPHVDKEVRFILHWPGLGCKWRGCIFHQQHLEEDTNDE